MNKLKGLLVALPVAVLVMAALAGPVYAQNGSGDSGSGDTTNATTTSTDSNSADTTGTSGDAAASGADHVTAADRQKVEQQAKTDAQDVLEKAKEAKQAQEKLAQNEQEREHRCTNVKDGLQTKLDSLNTNVQRYKSVVDGIYNKALAYQKDNNVTVANWATLTATADADQVTAETAVQALASLKPNLDCTNPNVATQVATFKAATAKARTALFAYRDAVRAVLTALEAAKQ